MLVLRTFEGTRSTPNTRRSDAGWGGGGRDGNNGGRRHTQVIDCGPVQALEFGGHGVAPRITFISCAETTPA
jgi:hypothetical protein